MTTKKKTAPVRFTSEATNVINREGEELGSIFKDNDELLFEPYGSAITLEELVAITAEMATRAQAAA